MIQEQHLAPRPLSLCSYLPTHSQSPWFLAILAFACFQLLACPERRREEKITLYEYFKKRRENGCIYNDKLLGWHSISWGPRLATAASGGHWYRGQDAKVFVKAGRM